MLKRYPLSGLIAQGKPAAGLILNCHAPALVEIAGYAGFDFVMIDCEHGPLEPAEVESMVRAAELAGIAPLVRVPSGEPHVALRVLDVGAAGVIVPRIESAATARRAIDSVFYPPVGQRGAAPSTRAAGYGVGMKFEDYLDAANRDLLVLPIIETPAGIAAVDEILALPEIKAIVVGPTDLAVAMGHGRDRNAAEVVAAVRHVAERTRAHGKALVLPAATQDKMIECLDMGATLVIVPIGSWMIEMARPFLAPVTSRRE